MVHSAGPGNVHLTNCIVWANGFPFPNSLDFGGNIGVWAQNSLLSEAPNFDEGGNIYDDPMFVDAPNGDYRLQSGSPAIDAGDSTELPADAADVDNAGACSRGRQRLIQPFAAGKHLM